MDSDIKVGEQTVDDDHIGQPDDLQTSWAYDNYWTNEFQEIHHLYEQAPTGITISLLGSAALAWWLLPFVPEFILIPWFSFITLTSVVHLFIVREFKNNKKHINTHYNWAAYNAFLFSMVGLAWGVGYSLFFPYLNYAHQVFLFYAIGILAIGFLPVLAALLSGYISFLTSIVLPLFLLIFNNFWNQSVLMITTLLGSYALFIFIAKNYQMSLNKSYSLATTISKQARHLVEDNEQSKIQNQKLKKETENYRKNAYKVLGEKEQAFKTLQSISEAVITTDMIGKVTYVNPVAEVFLGWSKEDIYGKRLTKIFNIVDEKTRKKLVDPIEKCVNSKTIQYDNERTLLLRRDGIEYCIEFSISPVLDKQSEIIGTVLIFRDVTEKRNLEKNLTWQASHDPLTGLINRREFELRLSKILHSINDTRNQHALCYIDLDFFKIVNDSCGHLAGDELLIKIANRLKSKTRDTDTLARIGGDEFGVILYSCSLEKARLIAEVFREQVEKLDFKWEGKQYNVTASIGVISINSNFTELSDVLRTADISCYGAKDMGRNHVNILNANDDIIHQNRDDMNLVETIKDCLNKEALHLFYQEIHPLDELNEVSIGEILLRMQGPEENMLLPREYLPRAEKYHLMPDVDRWVVKASLELIAYGHPVLDKFNTLAINLSEQSILDERFIDYLVDLLDDYEVENHRICFDVPEKVLQMNFKRVENFISILKSRGNKIALDEFSSGFNTFKSIKSLNVDYVKFDGRIINNRINKGLEYKIIESVNNISHQLGIQTIAKYVSEESNMDMLYKIGVDFIQSFILSEPKPTQTEQPKIIN